MRKIFIFAYLMAKSSLSYSSMFQFSPQISHPTTLQSEFNGYAQKQLDDSQGIASNTRIGPYGYGGPYGFTHFRTPTDEQLAFGILQTRTHFKPFGMPASSINGLPRDAQMLWESYGNTLRNPGILI